MTDTAGHRSATSLLLLGALGVVYGDIGTSPLYAVSETFFGHFHIPTTPDNVFGAISLIFWALTIVISVKYVGLIMCADNNGEGGIFALWALITNNQRSPKTKQRIPSWIGAGIAVPILIGACLLYGDGMITPAISVLSAVEGLQVVTPAAQPYVVPVTLLILASLFSIQKRGSRSLGWLFGPVMLIWFVAIALLGVLQILKHPEVIKALNPVYAVNLLAHYKLSSVYILGAVVLCVTGGEALYADMGHFGHRAIGQSWLGIVFPCLLLNYFGQGAVLLSGQPIANNHVFYAVCPAMLMIPMVILATVATIIASQALISGAFSMTQQAIALGVFPRLKIIHTNPEVRGQIYVPFINFLLFIGCVTLVLGFRSSGNLAAAYGLAVTGTMVITTLSFFVVTHYVLQWKLRWILPVFLVLFAVDLSFFFSNLMKFSSGGYVPVIIGLAFFLVMDNWRWGRQWLSAAYQRRFGTHELTVEALIEKKRQHTDPISSVSLVVMASRPVLTIKDTVPPVMAAHYKSWKILPKHLIFFSVFQENTPFIPEAGRTTAQILSQGEEGTIASVQTHYGYMEQPNVRAVLAELKNSQQIKIPRDPKKWLVLIGMERFITPGKSLRERGRLLFFSRLNRLSKPITDYFGLETDSSLAIETINI
ncbi:MAG: KUP/HAK/KT family potassium transporter [Myxococcales bacterium]|nr:KUP/HAK/KT family potassium transporter [Myxococcales bacterium]